MNTFNDPVFLAVSIVGGLWAAALLVVVMVWIALEIDRWWFRRYRRLRDEQSNRAWWSRKG